MNYNVNEIFGQILDSEERVIKVVRPNKKRFVLVESIKAIIGFVAVFLFGVLWLALGGEGWTDGEGNPVDSPDFVGYIIIAIAVLIAVISIAVMAIRYSKTYYAITEKRILIRTGVIGADYRELALDQMSSINVNVDLLDKFVNPNTGTIVFGSASTPMMMFSKVAGNDNGAFMYSFAHVDNPYQLYKEIKEASDAAKANK